jgi:hypothetical protein
MIVMLLSISACAAARNGVWTGFAVSAPSRPSGTFDPLNGVMPTGVWTVAARGAYAGHEWVRYTTTAERGVCMSLEIDGEPRYYLGTTVPPMTDPSGQTIPDLPSPPVYDGKHATCSPLDDPVPVDFLGGQLIATPASYGFFSGLVPNGASVQVKFSDGTVTTIAVIDHLFTEFYGPGTQQPTNMIVLSKTGQTIGSCPVMKTNFGSFTEFESGC